MRISILNRIKLKWVEFVISKDKNFPVEKELFLRVTKLAMEPVGPRNVPFFRTRHSKKGAFKVLKGGKD